MSIFNNNLKAKISIIGCGNMGGAIARPLSEYSDIELSLYDNDKKRLESFSKEIGAMALESIEDSLSSDIVILAVKPQILPSLYSILKGAKCSFISIAAGIPLEILEKNLENNNIVRFMPNIAAEIKQSVTAVIPSKKASKDLAHDALTIAESFGSAFLMDESKLPSFIGVSGSGIAYVFEFLHALSMGAVHEGMPYNEALSIARETVVAACNLQESRNLSPVEMATMVCSAGGTTIEGMKALADGAFDSTVEKAVIAASQKSIKLETQLLKKDK